MYEVMQLRMDEIRIYQGREPRVVEEGMHAWKIDVRLLCVYLDGAAGIYGEHFSWITIYLC